MGPKEGKLENDVVCGWRRLPRGSDASLRLQRWKDVSGQRGRREDYRLREQHVQRSSGRRDHREPGVEGVKRKGEMAFGKGCQARRWHIKLLSAKVVGVAE